MPEDRIALALTGLVDAVAAPPPVQADPYARMAGPVHLDGFIPSPQISASDVAAIHVGIEKARTDKALGAQVGQVIGMLMSALKAGAMALLLIACAGCTSTPPSIAAAHRMEGQAAALYRSDVLRYLLAQESDLGDAYDLQAELIRDYELRLSASADGKIDLPRVMALLDGAKAKRAEIEGRLVAARAKLQEVEGHWRVAADIHAAVQGYLAEPGLGADDAAKLIGQVGELRNRGAAQPAEEVRP